MSTSDHDLSRIRQRAAADEVVEVLTDAIRGGYYEVGQRLPTENDLALKLGVSRTVLREALSVLRRAGVVSIRRGATGGTFIESLANLSAVIAAGSQREETARPLLETRRAIEPLVTVLTASRATDDDLLELERLVDTLETLLDTPEEFFEFDIRFHLVIGDMCRNPVLADFQRETMRRLSVLAAASLAREAEPTESLARQRQLYEAITSRDAGVVMDALDVHLVPLEEHLLGERLYFVDLGRGQEP